MKEPDWIHEDKVSKPATARQRIFLHIAISIIFPFCIWAGWFELTRAVHGNWRAWVYSFEWPLIGFTAIYLWRRFLSGNLPKIPRPDLPEE